MFFSKSKPATAERNFPCLTLNIAPNVVPLPGILYKLTFEKEIGQNILRELERLENPRRRFSLDNNNDDQTLKNPKLSSVFTENNSFDKEISRCLILIPSGHGNPCVGCLAKIVGVLFGGEEVMIISLKSERRAIVNDPLINSGSQVFQSPIEIINDNAQISMNKQLAHGPQELKRLFHLVDNAIKTFRLRQNECAKSKSSSEHLFLLSPLSNALSFQFNQTEFTKPWRIILNRITDLENDSKKKRSPDVYLEVFNLVDLMTAVLPTTSSQKLAILATTDLTDRFTIFENILRNFRDMFETLRISTEYVQKYFSGASSLSKSKLIANQLKSLRVFINDIKFRDVLAAKAEKSKNREEQEEDDMNVLRKFIDNLQQCGVHPDGIKILRKDFKRLAGMSPHNMEYQLLKNYFDIITDIPFGKYGMKKSIDLDRARAILEKDHYGLKTVKRRLLEYICTLKLQEKFGNIKKKSPILLLVGPPGVGKTSIAKSAAHALDRKFQRISLGGIHNEAEIRGHRRTYVGSMCGVIINALRKSGCMNPLILLDEIDKVLSSTGNSPGYSSKINGDPGAALLEVLDPEQNNAFVDHYVGFPVDLSQVLFFCTANDLGNISRPLLDRMEIIEISGYTIEEKIQIGTNFLLPKQITINGLDKCNGTFRISDKAWESLILEYTREPGVRSLERQLAAVVRGKIREVVETGKYARNDRPPGASMELLQPKDLLKYLGFPLHPIPVQEINHSGKKGIVNGLSYNSDGTGSVLVFEVVKTGSTEATRSPKNGPIIISTGNLGRVLRESIDIAKSLVKSILRRQKLLIVLEEFLTGEYHLHVPAGAISKDGPSAGAAITLCLLSAALKKPVDPALCMTGEITVRGKILPIGGVKGKLLGARIYGMRKVLIPLANRPELVEIVTDDVSPFANKQNRRELSLIKQKMNLQVCYVDTIYDVIDQAWPDLARDSSSSSSGTWVSQDGASLKPRL